jgi:sec-independent protein translocase protein TatC
MADVQRLLRQTGRLVGAGLGATRRGGGTTRRGRAVEDSRMSLVEHLKELRRRLLIAIIAVGLVTLVIAIWGYHSVFDLLRRPYCHVPENRRTGGAGCNLIFTHPTDAFFVRLKVSLIAGLALSSPIWLYQV